MEINGLTIKFDPDSEKWQVVTPDGRILEEFEKQAAAELWASDIFDFAPDSY